MRDIDGNVLQKIGKIPDTSDPEGNIETFRVDNRLANVDRLDLHQIC